MSSRETNTSNNGNADQTTQNTNTTSGSAAGSQGSQGWTPTYEQAYKALKEATDGPINDYGSRDAEEVVSKFTQENKGK